MINSFGDELTQKIFNSIQNKKVSLFLPEIRKIVKRKLDMIEFAANLQDLRSPPANRLEKLKGNLENFYSIRINDQWRIIFEWKSDGAYNVQVTDYH